MKHAPTIAMSELRAMFVSMDSTVRSNLSVGLPLDLVVIPAGEYRISANRRVEATDPDWQTMSEGWAGALRTAFHTMPDVVI